MSEKDSKSCKIMVALRVRPKGNCDGLVVDTYPEIRQLKVKVPKLKDFKKVGRELKGGEQMIQRILSNEKKKNNMYSYDRVYSPQTPQDQVYNDMGVIILKNCMEGYNSCLFAYGQTGSGKTHTMMGPKVDCPEDQKGIIPRLCRDIFQETSKIEKKEGGNVKYKVEVSMIEIYNEKVKDLFTNKENLEVRDRGKNDFHIPNLSKQEVKDSQEIEFWLNCGSSNRTIAKTLMNDTSSRAHTVFQIRVTQTIIMKERGEGDVNIETTSLVNLIDLAGSEQMNTAIMGNEKKLQDLKKRKKELIEINKSLSALGRCIKALHEKFSEGKKKKKKYHIPYRDSTLTKLIANSLGGNSKTIMIATLSPDPYHYEQTVSTCRFADRVKNIKNKPIVNIDPKDKIIKELRGKIKELENKQMKYEEETEGEEAEDEEPVVKEESEEASIEQNTEEVEKLKEMLKEKDQELIELKERAEVESRSAKKLLSAQLKEKRDLKAKVTVMEEDLTRAKDLQEQRVSQIEILKSQRDAIQTKAKSLMEEKQVLEEFLEQRMKDLEMMKERVARNTEKKRALEEEIKKMEKEREETVRTYEDIGKKREKVIKELKKDQESLDGTVTEKNQIMNDRLKKFDAKESKLMKRLLADYDEKIKESSSKLRSQNYVLSKKKKDLLLLSKLEVEDQKEYEKKGKEVETKEKEKKRMELTMGKLIRQHEKVMHTLDASVKRMDASEKVFVRLEKAVEEKEKKLDVMYKDMVREQQRVSDLEKQKARVVHELKNLKQIQKEKEKEEDEKKLIQEGKVIDELLRKEKQNQERVSKIRSDRSSKEIRVEKLKMENMKVRLNKQRNNLKTTVQHYKDAIQKSKGHNCQLQVKMKVFARKLGLQKKIAAKKEKMMGRAIRLKDQALLKLEKQKKDSEKKMKKTFEHQLLELKKQMEEKNRKEAENSKRKEVLYQKRMERIRLQLKSEMDARVRKLKDRANRIIKEERKQKEMLLDAAKRAKKYISRNKIPNRVPFSPVVKSERKNVYSERRKGKKTKSVKKTPVPRKVENKAKLNIRSKKLQELRNRRKVENNSKEKTENFFNSVYQGFKKFWV